MYALLENIPLDDRTHAAKIVAARNNVTLSYASNKTNRKGNKRRKRKRSSIGIGDTTEDNAPPDKRRNLGKDFPSSKKGRALIGAKVKVEFQEQRGNKMTNIGWFLGKIVAYNAYNRRDGYFVEFHDQENESGKYKGWSEWIEDVNSPDVQIDDP